MNRQSKETIKPSFKTLAFFFATNGLLLGLIVILFIYAPQLKHALFQSSLDNYDKMVVTNGFHAISLPNGQSWTLSYEENHDTVFHGQVRHISPIDISKFAILSHDILITSGDFSDSDLVSTRVSNHRFIWHPKNGIQPDGSINLLHTVPINQDIFLKLKEIKNGDVVRITGWEILRIEGWNSIKEYEGYWQDAGCNTTLVTEVVIEK